MATWTARGLLSSCPGFNTQSKSLTSVWLRREKLMGMFWQKCPLNYNLKAFTDFHIKWTFNIFFPDRLKGVKLQPAGMFKATAGRDEGTVSCPLKAAWSLRMSSLMWPWQNYSISPRNDAGLQLSIRLVELRVMWVSIWRQSLWTACHSMAVSRVEGSHQKGWLLL